MLQAKVGETAVELAQLTPILSGILGELEAFGAAKINFDAGNAAIAKRLEARAEAEVVAHH